MLVLAQGCAALPHAVADDFAAAEWNLVPICGEVVFDLDQEFCVSQPQAVAHCGAVQAGVGASVHGKGHRHTSVSPG